MLLGHHIEASFIVEMKMVTLLSGMLVKLLLFVRLIDETIELIFLVAQKVHVGGVTKIQWLEKSSVLITSGKDKKISVRKFD